MDRILSLSLMWIGGFLIGISVGMNSVEDTGAKCVSMYETPEDISECIWILQNAK